MADKSTSPPGTFLTWLLARLSEGEKLTETKALNRAFVREVSRMRPNWYEEELFGPPHREFDLPILELMHQLVRDFKLARRYKGKLVLTSNGRELLARLLEADDEEPAMTLSSNILREVLLGMGSGTLDEVLAVNACKIGASGHQLGVHEYVDIARDAAVAHGFAPPRSFQQRVAMADSVRTIIWLAMGLDLCDYLPDDRTRDRVVFSASGMRVIRDAGVTGRAEIAVHGPRAT